MNAREDDHEVQESARRGRLVDMAGQLRGALDGFITDYAQDVFEGVLPSTRRGPRLFELHRDEDETGVSGTGIVAEGVVFTDGPVALRWIVGEHRSTVVWPNIEAVEAIHGHGGRTRIVWT